jgi:hypothetical protein
MINPNIGKTLGLRDMHPMQVKMLMEFIDLTVQLASMTNDMDVLDETEAAADELVKIFGGNGIKITIEDY